MMRSAAVPGWGQLTNRKYWKAAVVVAGEGLLAYEALHELHLENQAVDRLGAALTDSAAVAADQDRLLHGNRKINWIWWGVAAHLLSMVDAYVDAHLSSFETDFGPPEKELGAGGSPRLMLAFRVRF